MKKFNGRSLVLSAIALTLLAVPAFALPTPIDNIYMLFGSNITYFNGASQQFGFTSGVPSAKIQSAASAPGVYDYQILNATFSFNLDDLVNDNSAGGIAKADFKGGCSITLSGDIKRLSDSAIIYTGTNVFTATMTIPLAETWLLEEEATYMVASMFFDPTSGFLFDGGQLSLGQFRLAFKALPSPNPSNFVNSQKCLTQGIEITSVPEPATMAILGLGGLLLARRRRA